MLEKLFVSNIFLYGAIIFMKRFFRFGLPAIAFFTFINMFTAAETNAQILREILNRMDNHYKALSSLQADVLREQANVQLGDVDKYEGKIVMVPGKGRSFSLRLDWVKPKEEVISVVNGQYVLYVPGINRAYTGSSNSQKITSGGGGNVLKAMSMSESELNQNYTVDYLGQETLSSGTPVWHLKLTPKTKAQYKFAELWVDKDGMPLQGKVVANNNDTDTFLLKNPVKNKSIDGKIFKVTLPGNVEHIKQ